MTRRRMLLAGLAAAAGLAIFVSQPPVSWWFLALVAPALLLEAVRRADGPVWWLGVVAGLAVYLPMLGWLVLPAGYVAWILLSLIQSLFLVATVLVARPFVSRGWIVLVAPVAWTGFDVWRNLVPLGGFGWGSLAYAHVDGSWMLPVARVLGEHGLTFLTVLIGTLLFHVARVAQEGGNVRGRAREGFRGLQPAFAGLLAALLASVAITVEPPAQQGSLEVLIVQGNDDPVGGGGHGEDLRIASRMLELTRAAVDAGGAPDLAVWPESSVDRDPYTGDGEDLRPIVTDAAGVVGGGLLLGVNLEGPRPGTFRNASVLVGPDGEPDQTYVKRHLVPFGEFVPWRSVIGGFGPLQQIPRDGIPGEGPQTIEVSGVPIATLICFETLFPPLVREHVNDEGAALIVASTNDASFGRSSEPAQHLAQSRLRAVESGRWIVHAALSGASAFVDPTGGVHDETEVFEATTIRREVPLAVGTTPFLTVGDPIGFGSRFGVLVLALALVVVHVRRRRAGPESP